MRNQRRFPFVLPEATQRWLPPLVLALLPWLVFLPLTLVRQTWYVHDIQDYFYPYHAISAAMVARGEWPLWNPYAFSGIPLIGDGQTAMFYPPNWLFFILPGAAALNYAILLQWSIAGVGMYGCARSHALSRVAACVAALTFMFCGMMTARVVHLSIMSGVALVPLVFWCVDRALERRTARAFVAAAVAVGLQAVAGHPQIPVYTGVALLLLTLARAAERTWVDDEWRAWWALPLRLIGVYVLGYALAAIQLVPWVELGLASPRAAGASFDFVFGGSSRGADWLLFLFPYVFGAQESGLFAQQPIGITLAVRAWEHAAYVGVLTLPLAVVGLAAGVVRAGQLQRMRNVRRADVRRSVTLVYLLVLLVLALLFAAGKYTPFGQVIYALPVLGKLRDVERMLALAAFALCLSAGFGLDHLRHARDTVRKIRRPGLLVVAFVVVLVPLVVLAAHNLGASPDLPELSLARPNAYVPLLLALASAALLVWWSFHPTNARSQTLAMLLVSLDMTVYAAAYNPTTDASLYARRPQVLGAFAGDGEPFRKATVLLNNNAFPNTIAQEALAVSWGMVYGIEDINGFNSLQPRRYTDFVFGPNEGDVSYGYLPQQQLLQSDNPVLNQLNVRYILVPVSATQPVFGSHLRQIYENAEVRVYENPNAYPRAFFADSVRAETDARAVLAAVTAPNFDGRRVALLETPTTPNVSAPNAADTVQIRSIAPARIELATTTAAARMLVLSEMYFSGWRAYVDGAETPIYQTNYLFRGVVAPPGTHTITFEYQPRSVVLGAGVTLVAALACGWLALRRPRQNAML